MLEDSDGRVVLRVRGSAHREVEPDHGDVYVRVSCVDGFSRDGALEAAAAVSSGLRAALSELGDEVLEVKLSRVSVQPNRRMVDDSWVDDGFVASVAGSVRAPVAAASKVAAMAAAQGVEVTSVHWALDKDNPVRREVRTDAVRDAFVAAQDFASAIDTELGDLVELADPGLSSDGAQSRSRASAVPLGAAGGWGSDAVVESDPQPIRVTASVEATFLA